MLRARRHPCELRAEPVRRRTPPRPRGSSRHGRAFSLSPLSLRAPGTPCTRPHTIVFTHQESSRRVVQMNITRIVRALVFCLSACFAIAPAAYAQTQTGTVEGKIVDQQNAVLPGVNVTLTGPRGSQTTVSEGDGTFRFVGVAPGTYTLKAELPGFLPQEQTDVLVGMAKTVTAEFSLKVGGVTEAVEVRAASNVDVKSTETHTNLSNDLLTLAPVYSPTSTGLLNYAPGINSNSAYGAQASYGNALLMDG